MIGRIEVRRSLEGAWRLFLNRPEAMLLFDLSIEGFWRSFQAIVLIAPIYALTVIADEQHLLNDSIAETGFSEAAFLFGRAVALLLDWVTFPILLALVARRLGIARSYPAYIVARNWSGVIASAPFGAIALLTLIGLVSNEFGALLSLVAIGVALRYNYVVARTALAAGFGFAVAIVAADFIVSLLIADGVERLFALPGSGQ
jgi:hypothetical protein